MSHTRAVLSRRLRVPRFYGLANSETSMIPKDPSIRAVPKKVRGNDHCTTLAIGSPPSALDGWGVVLCCRRPLERGYSAGESPGVFYIRAGLRSCVSPRRGGAVRRASVQGRQLSAESAPPQTPLPAAYGPGTATAAEAGGKIHCGPGVLPGPAVLLRG